MSITTHLSGVPEFDKAIVGLTLKVDEASRRIVELGGLKIASDAKRLFLTRPSGSQRKSKAGRIYFSFKPPYQAQPPAPTNRSGALSRSIKIQRISPIKGGWKSETGPDRFYAEYVEYGTSKMQKEPFIGKALDDGTEGLTEIARIEWEKVMA